LQEFESSEPPALISQVGPQHGLEEQGEEVAGWGGPGKWVINIGLHLEEKRQVSVSRLAEEAVALSVLFHVGLAYEALRGAQQLVVIALSGECTCGLRNW